MCVQLLHQAATHSLFAVWTHAGPEHAPRCVHACAHALKQLGSKKQLSGANASDAQSPRSAITSEREGREVCAALRMLHATPVHLRAPARSNSNACAHAAEQSDEPDCMCMVQACCCMAACKRRTAGAVSCMGGRREFACAGAHRRLPQHRWHRLPPLLTRCKPRRSSASMFVWQRPESGDRCHSQFFQAAIANASERAAQGARTRWLCWPGPTAMCEG